MPFCNYTPMDVRPRVYDPFTGRGITRIVVSGTYFESLFQVLSCKMDGNGADDAKWENDIGGSKTRIEDPVVGALSMLIGPAFSLIPSR